MRFFPSLLFSVLVASAISSAFAFDLRLNHTVSDPLLSPGGTPLSGGSVRIGTFLSFNDSELNSKTIAELSGDFFDAVPPGSLVDHPFAIGGVSAGLYRFTNQVVATNPSGGGNISLADYNSRLEGRMVYMLVGNSFPFSASTEVGVIEIPVAWRADEESVGGSNVTTNATFNSSNLPMVHVGTLTSYGTPGTGTATGNGFRLKAFANVATVGFQSSLALTVQENAGAQQLTVQRTGLVGSTVTVQYAFADTGATNGTDYTGTNGVLTFGPNITSQTIPFSVIPRAMLQGDRSFTVTLSGANPGDTVIANPGAVTLVTIQDVVVAGQLQFSANAYSGLEDSGPITVTVQRVGGTDGAVSAIVTTVDGTAVSSGANADFTALTAITGAVTFANGDSTPKTISIPITADSIFEPDETFQVNLTALTGGATTGTPASATVTILNDDMAPTSGTVSLTAAAFSGPESGSIAITAARTGGSLGALSVQYATSDGTAIAGSDYTATSGTLRWADGESGLKTILVPILPDGVFEPDETFTLTLSNPSVTGALQAPTSATVTIINDDPPQRGTFAFSSANYIGREVDGLAVITVLRSGGADVPITLAYTLSGGTATPILDYSPTSGTLSFAAGELIKTFDVTIVNDTLVEPDETVNLALASPVVTGDDTDTDGDGMTNGQEALAGTNPLDAASVLQATIALDGNDALVSFPSVAGRIYTVECSPNMNGGNWTPTVSGIAGTGAVVTRRIVGALQNPCGFFRVSVAAGEPSGAVLTIISDDLPATFRFGAAAYTANEGAAPTTITVIRTGGLDQTLSVNVDTSNGTAVAGSDFTAVSRTLTFAPNDTEESFTVQAINDTTPEPEETFSVILVKVDPNDPQVALGTPSVATVTIGRSDFTDRPDNAVAVKDGPFVGNNVYNTSGDGQIASKTLGGNSTATFTLRAQNDGNVLDSFLVRGVNSGSSTKATVKYFRSGTEITGQITGVNGYTLTNLLPGASAEIEVQVKFSGGQSLTGYGATLTTSSVGTPATTDVARVLGIVQ